MNRRGFVGILAGLSGLLGMGRSRPTESRPVRELVGPEGQAGPLGPQCPAGPPAPVRECFASTDWGVDRDIGTTTIYWIGSDGIFHILAQHECTAEQVENESCPCRRYFSTPGHPPGKVYIPSRLHREDEIALVLTETNPNKWKLLAIDRIP
jgi:hypothetical protein